MIEAHELTKRYGDTTAVHSLSFTIAPGTVTGFLGPNGAGKSTTMRMIMGLDRPTSGTVTVNGKPYRQHRAPLREVGALLEARPCTPAAAPAHTCAPWPPPTTSRPPGSARSVHAQTCRHSGGRTAPLEGRTDDHPNEHPEPARQPAIRLKRRSKR